MKFKNPYPKDLDREQKIPQLRAAFEAAQKTADVGERLFRLKAVERAAERLSHDLVDRQLVYTGPAGGVGAVLMVFGLATANPLAVAGGAAVIAGTLGGIVGYGRDSLRGTRQLGDEARAAVNTLYRDMDMEALARSSRLQQVLGECPHIRVKFFEASKAKMVEAATLPPPQSRPGQPGGFRL